MDALFYPQKKDSAVLKLLCGVVAVLIFTAVTTSSFDDWSDFLIPFSFPSDDDEVKNNTSVVLAECDAV